MSWLTRLLPYVEQDALWGDAIRAFATNKWFESPPHVPILGRVMPIFACPSDATSQQQWDLGAFQVAFTDYQGNEGTTQVKRDGVLFLDSRIRFADIQDGTSNTLLVGERPPSEDHNLGWWYAGWGQDQDGSAEYVLCVNEMNTSGTRSSTCPLGPYEFAPGNARDPCDAFHFWSLHPGGANFAFADGSVHFMAYSAASIMPALATRAGGEVVSAPD